ncbi:hypothetical protein ACHAWF_003570 [Thalassiosira exigua]
MPPPAWAGRHAREIPSDPEAYVFFLSKDDASRGCFSNAHREPDGGHRAAESFGKDEAEGEPRFWCVNQELHYRKAALFEDRETARQILAEGGDAAEIKRLGRAVRNYDDAEWREVRYEVCYNAVYAKFAQNPELKRILLDTGTKIIVEAAKDATWGIGVVEFSSDDSLGAKDKETGGWDVPPEEWKGENLLGRCLMDAREVLREEGG